LAFLAVKIDLILCPAEGEVDGLIGWAAAEVVCQRDDYSLGVARRGLAAMSTVRRDRGYLPGTFGGGRSRAAAVAVDRSARRAATAVHRAGSADMGVMARTMPVMRATASVSVRPWSRHRERQVQNETAWPTGAAGGGCLRSPVPYTQPVGSQ